MKLTQEQCEKLAKKKKYTLLHPESDVFIFRREFSEVECRSGSESVIGRVVARFKAGPEEMISDLFQYKERIGYIKGKGYHQNNTGYDEFRFLAEFLPIPVTEPKDLEVILHDFKMYRI